MNQEKRTFMRVSTRIAGYARRVASPETRPARYDSLSPQSGSPTENLKGAKVPDALIEYLEHINHKLDMILTAMGQKNLIKEFPIRIEVVELSGAGLQFTSTQTLSQGDNLEVVMEISKVPLRLAGGIGQIQRVETEHDRPVYVMDFTQIRDEDREAIVGFVFQEQRSQIRENW